MIEVGAAEISEADLLEALKFGIEEGINPILELDRGTARKVQRS